MDYIFLSFAGTSGGEAKAEKPRFFLTLGLSALASVSAGGGTIMTVKKRSSVFRFGVMGDAE